MMASTAPESPETPRRDAQDAPVTPAPAAAAPEPRHVTLAVSGALSALHLPPIDEGGEAVVITAEGTQVDEATARRAREAAREAGFSLAEVAP
jgi:hypothetical protein